MRIYLYGKSLTSPKQLICNVKMLSGIIYSLKDFASFQTPCLYIQLV
jgi:hypothetical protein